MNSGLHYSSVGNVILLVLTGGGWLLDMVAQKIVLHDGRVLSEAGEEPSFGAPEMKKFLGKRNLVNLWCKLP